jgi:hypothetical protein
MNTIPSVLAILLCDVIIIDQETKKTTLVGLFENLNVGAFPTMQKVGLFARLTDMEGPYKFMLRIVRLDGDKEELMAGAEFEHQANDRLANLNVALNLPGVPFTAPGRHEFQLFADGIYIGRAALAVQQAVQPSA